MKKHTEKSILQRLHHPSAEARGYTRWWWFGCAVEREEICRELDEMVQAGIGGVELQILYPLVADPENGRIQNRHYLSPGFFSSVRFAAEEAKKRGMKFDMTLGSSWPFGGPFISEELSAPNVTPYIIDVHGPCDFQYDFTTRVYGTCMGCVMGQMEHAEMLPETIVDLTDHIVDKYLFGWEWGKELLPVHIPEGDYKIIVLISNDKRQQVLKPLPGGEGLIIDHDRKDALRCFLKNGGDPLAENVGKDLIQSFFCDSIEVFGQNWTNILYKEFEIRRGYDLKPYIYALWGDIKGLTDRIRYDFHKTLAELTEENFFKELTKWCHEKGCTSRIQAHGTWGDILKCYGAADIPEGETFSEYDRYEVNTVHRRLASSAGHLYDRKIISNESFTWLRFARFTETLEAMKAAVDSIFLDGMNQIVNHGFAYSLPEKGSLSTPFYAASAINDKNTWWHFYGELAQYITRVSDWLRTGNQVVRIAVYLPQADIWSENPLSDIHMSMKLEERITTAFSDGIQKAGYWFDYINDDVLQDKKTERFEALILPNCIRIPLETTEALEEYGKKGGKLLCAGHIPEESCGLVKHQERSERVRECFKRMEKSGICLETEFSCQAVINELEKMIKADIKIYFRPDIIGYVHRKSENLDIWFLSNVSGERVEEKLLFYGMRENVLAVDPMTGEKIPVSRSELSEDGCTLFLSFEPFQSVFFFFSEDLEPVWEQEPLKQKVWKDISENWILSVEAKNFIKKYKCLIGWEQEAELKFYSGQGIYRKEIIFDEEDWQQVRQAQGILLKFSNIGEAAEILVNGKAAGNLWKHPYEKDVYKYLKPGKNVLEVRVSNLLINRAIDPQYPEKIYPEPLIRTSPYSTAKLNAVRKERMFCGREREMIQNPYPSGLWGKIELVLLLQR